MARLTAESGSPLLGVVAMFALLVATLTTNIAANIVAPANSFANLAPARISFRIGGLIAGALGVVILPWKLLDRYQAWLITYSGLLGAVGGVICGRLRRGAARAARRWRISTAGRRVRLSTAASTGARWSPPAAGIVAALLGLAGAGAAASCSTARGSRPRSSRLSCICADARRRRAPRRST